MCRISDSTQVLLSQLDAHPDIAAAWNRLRSGAHEQADIQSFNHERIESMMEQLYRLDYRAAHDAVQDRYPSGVE